MKKNFQKLGVAVLFLGTFYATLATKYYYTRNRPEAPRKEEGLLYPAQVYYLKTVFVSENEKRLLDSIPWIQAGLFVTIGALASRDILRKQKGLETFW